MTDFFRGIIFPIILTITTRTITTRMVDPYDNNGATYDIAPADSATIQAVQSQLLSLGYYNGSIDGVFGPSTRDAVAKYQIANHLNVTGSLSPDTIQSLGVIQPTAS